MRTNINYIKKNIGTNYKNNNTNYNSIYKNSKQIKSNNVDILNFEENNIYNEVLSTGKLKFEDIDLERIAQTENDAYNGNFTKASRTDFKMARLSYEIKNNGLVKLYDSGIEIGYTDIFGLKNLKAEYKKRHCFCDLMNYLIDIDEKKTLKKATEEFKNNKNITPIKTTLIPNDIKQGPYTVTCYESDGWHLGGSEKPTEISRSSEQKKVHNIWNEQGSNYKNGIATLNVDGKNRYLIAVSEGIGKVGDILNIKLKNGDIIPCVVADAKSVDDKNYTEFGHKFSYGINVLEFEVNTQKFNKIGKNPGTEEWPVEWDSSSPVKSVENLGTIIKI